MEINFLFLLKLLYIDLQNKSLSVTYAKFILSVKYSFKQF